MPRAGLLLFLVLAGCQPRGDALRVTLLAAPGRADTCFVLEVRDASGGVQAEARVPRVEDQPRYVVAVFRDALPGTVTLVARALAGADCSADARPNGESAPVEVSFDPKRVVEVTVDLTPGDDDGDGFVALAGGGQDCDDTTPLRSPAATEVCRGVVDFDCDGQAGCLDTGCPPGVCGDAPWALSLAGVPTALELDACGAATLEVHDAAGRLTRISPAVTVELGGASFFSDPGCTTPASSRSLAESAPLYFSSSMLGPATLVASSSALRGASATVDVVRSPPAAVRFMSGSPAAVAGACSPPVLVGLFDARGRSTLALAPLDVTVTSSAGQPFALYGDGACTQALTTLPFPADAGEGRFFFSGQRAGPFTLRVDAASLTGDELAAGIDAGPVATVQLVPTTQELLAGQCSPAFIVEARDAFSNRVAPQALTVDVPDAGAQAFTPGCGGPVSGASFSVLVPDEGRFVLTARADGVSASLPLTVKRPGPPGSRWRWPLEVATGARAPAKGYQGYTLLAAFDSRAAVDAGLVSSDGNSLRVHAWEDGGWRELDRVIEGVGTNATLVRFASASDLPSSATDLRYALFSGPFDGGVAPADPRRVYLFFDDFEEGTLSRWTVRGGAWARVTDRARSGTGALKYGAEGGGSHLVIEASPALDEADVMFEAWWNTSNTGALDFSQVVHLQPGVVRHYETNLENNAGWNIAWMNPGWAELSANRSSPAQNAWMRIGLSMSGADVRVWRDRVQVAPASGSYVAATPLIPGGNVGFRKWNVGGAVWLDDVLARRFTEPEPAVSVGAPMAVP